MLTILFNLLMTLRLLPAWLIPLIPIIEADLPEIEAIYSAVKLLVDAINADPTVKAALVTAWDTTVKDIDIIIHTGQANNASANVAVYPANTTNLSLHD